MYEDKVQEYEKRGYKIVSSFLLSKFKNCNNRVSQTQPGARYDLDFISNGNKIFVEYKERNVKYMPHYNEDFYFMLDINKLKYMVNNCKDRYSYLYVAFYPTPENDLFLINFDKYGKVEFNNLNMLEGLPILDNKYNIYNKGVRNKYGIYWDIKMARKTYVDANSPIVEKYSVFIPTKLFSHYQFLDGNWVKIK